ncbi:MAG: GNAT family N-acetyltransferase [Fimbriimonadaceae bacterium]|nr:GNAT family N-acetyltransferase [Fimbriimonadaceae bacterium]
MEVRPLHEAEFDRFLDLLCAAFSLDRRRSAHAFNTEPLRDQRMKWGLFNRHGDLVSILSVLRLEFGWGSASGFSNVATRRIDRGKGFAERLMREVLDHLRREGVEAALLFAHDPRLYARLGFTHGDRVVRANLVRVPPSTILEPMDPATVRELYDRWVEGSPGRLRRDESRWRYWDWRYGACYEAMDGYFRLESGVVREAVWTNPPWALEVGTAAEWIGTATVTADLDVPIENGSDELTMMVYRCPTVPEMFMSDQF